MLALVLGVALLGIAAVPYVLLVGVSWLWSPTGSPATKRDRLEPVSILLPTYNESAIIESTLERLCSLSYPLEYVELVVVDSSDDGTTSIVREFFADRDAPSLTLIEESDRGGVSRAVNRGIEAASHDLIFRTDCDSQLHEDVLSHAVANLADPTVGGVTGRQTDVLGDSAVEQSYRNLQARVQAIESHIDSTFIVHGPCFAFDRRLVETLSPDSLADDTTLAVSVRKTGHRVVMDPAMQFTEAGVSNIHHRRRRKDRRAMGLLQLLDRNHDLLGGYGRYGWFVIPLNWWLLVISPWLSIGGIALVLLGLLTTVSQLGVGALTALAVGIGLGQRDRLGPLQAPYAVFDSHLSLVIARIRLRREDHDGTWSIDDRSRELLE